MTQQVRCNQCTHTRMDLQTAIRKANAAVARYGTADTTELMRLKQEAAACMYCGGTGYREGTGARPTYRRDVAPKKTVKTAPAKPKPPAVPAEIIAAALDPKALATSVINSTSRGTRLSPTGHCHTCDRPVSGERRYCGPCAAAR